MPFKKGTRVRASQGIKGRFETIPKGTTGEVIAEHPHGITVKWDTPGFLFKALDTGSAGRLLEDEGGESNGDNN